MATKGIKPKSNDKSAKTIKHAKLGGRLNNIKEHLLSLQVGVEDHQSAASNLPENPLKYVMMVENPKGIKKLKKKAHGRRVAIIGGGSSGLCAAHELMRVGASPVVFETKDTLGGRILTHQFENGALAELGAMRIPASQPLIFHYLESLGVKERQKDFLVDGDWPLFPSPKAVNTQFYYQGKHFFYKAMAKPMADGTSGFYIGNPFLIQQVNTVSTKFDAMVAQDLLGLPELDKEYNYGFDLTTPLYQEYVGKRLAIWDKVVDTQQNVSLYNRLQAFNDPKLGSFSNEEIELIGTIGIGTGGIGALYTTAYLETLRETYHKDDTDQRLIVGGLKQLTDALWEYEAATVPGITTSVKAMNHSKFQRTVTAIDTPANPLEPVKVTYTEGGATHSEEFDAVIVTCSLRALEMGIKVSPNTFSNTVWDGIRNFGMVSSQKIFVRTKTAFWHEMNKDNGKNMQKEITTTLSDIALQQTYFFDKSSWGADRQVEGGVILMSYSWADDSIKFNAMTEAQKLRLCYDGLEEIYGKAFRERLEAEALDTAIVNWDLVDGVNGAFRMAYPGQYDMQEEMFNQGLGQTERNNGVYLAGEALSWYGLSGWIEGALQTGINASLAAINRLNLLVEEGK